MLKYSIYFILSLILSYILTKIMVWGNEIIGDAVDTMLLGETVNFEEFIILFLILTFLGVIANFLKSFFASKFSIKVQTMYKNLTAKKLYHLKYNYFDDNGSASIINKMNSDIAETDMLLNETLPELAGNFVSLVVYSIYVGKLNITLLFLIFLCYPIIMFFTNKMAKKMRALKKVFRQKSDTILDIIQDCVSGILVLRSFGAEEYFQKKLDCAAEDLVDNEAKRTRITNNAIIIRKILQWLPDIICAVYAYTLVLKGNLSVGELMAFIIILQKFVMSFIGIPFVMVDFKEKMVCVKRIENILNENDEPSGVEKTGTNEKIAVSFEKADFSYIENKKILNDISFDIYTGTKVAFVGESGGGKSTIFHILCGFYPINSGKYRLFGRDYKEWDIEVARENMALVSQNVFLFPTTIYENVKYGNLRASKDEIVEACKKAEIHNFIMSLPQGYETVVGERGVLLSGGERQRISIARAFLKNAPILLLDEPTSAIDVETERLIQQAIDKLSENKTCIIIAHRLSTIKNVDEIMVLKNGVVAEKGTHDELLKKHGVYAGMYGKETELKYKGGDDK